MHIYVCVHIYTFICTKIYPCSKHSCAHSVYISRDVRMCALPTAAWLTSDPSSATGRMDSSSRFRLLRTQGRHACTAAGGRGCRRQNRGTGRNIPVCVCIYMCAYLYMCISMYKSVHIYKIYTCKYIHAYIRRGATHHWTSPSAHSTPRCSPSCAPQALASGQVRRWV